MALTTITYVPNACPQLGLWRPVGAATGWQATSDGLDSTYVELPPGECKLDQQVLRLSFPQVVLPTGAAVLSVTLRRRIQTVDVEHIPICWHWFRCRVGEIRVFGEELEVFKHFFRSPCPTFKTVLEVSSWVNETVFTSTLGPDGQPWNPATNLADFTYDTGRGDDDLDSYVRIAQVWLDVTYQQESAVTVTAPTGTVPDTRPTIQWVYFSADNQLQQGYQIAVYTQAQTQASGFTPFTSAPIDGTNGYVLGSDLQWTTNIDTTNGSYAAYVQVESQWAGPGKFYSSIGSTVWTRSATGPPVGAVLSSATFDAENNRVALTFYPGGTSPATTSFTVNASRDGGQSWTPIPSLTYLAAQGMNTITGYDYVAALNEPSQYQVIAYGGTPLQAAAAPSATLSVTPTGTQHWLKDPSNPLLNTVLPVAAPKQSSDGIKITKRRMQGTFQLLGGAGSQVLPFIVSGPTYGDEYQIELIFIEDDPNTPMTLWAPVDELDRTGATLLWQQPDGTQLWVVTGPGVSGQDTEETFSVVSGDPTAVFWRRRKIVLTQVQAPSFY